MVFITTQTPHLMNIQRTSKRLRRIIDVYDISFPYKKVKTIKNGKEIPGEYDKELVGDE